MSNLAWSRRGFWLAQALYLAVSLVSIESIYEDGFIYFRVAANIAHGHGYVFNVGGEHIETGSSIVWQFLLALVIFLRLNVILMMKVIGISLGAATLYWTWQITTKLVRAPVLQAVPSLMLAVAFPFYIGVQRGLETPLYAFAVVLLASTLVDESLERYWPYATALVIFSRSEGFIVLAGLLGFLYFERADFRRNAVRLACLLAAMLAVYVGRYFYFHDFVPHPFYMKILFPNILAWGSFKAYFLETWTWAPLLVGGVGLLSRRSLDRRMIILAVLAAPFLWWGSWAGGSMAQYNQHLVPALPFLFILFARGLDQIVARLPALLAPLLAATAGFAVWMAFFAPSLGLGVHPVPNRFTWGIVRVATKPTDFLRTVRTIFTGRPSRIQYEDPFAIDVVGADWQYRIGDFVRRTYPKGITVLYDQMGQTPWYAGPDKTFIDVTGLTYRATGFAQFNESLPGAHSKIFSLYKDFSLWALARFGETSRTWTRAEAVDHLFALNPDLIIENAFNMPQQRPDGTVVVNTSNMAGLIAGDPRLKERYVRKEKPWLYFFERKDLAEKIQWAPVEHTIAGKADSVPPKDPPQSAFR